MKIIAKFCLLLAFFSTTTLLAQIKVEEKIKLHHPIVIQSTQVADVYLWTIKEPIKKVVAENGKIVYAWAPKGVYDVHLVTITVDWEAKKLNYNEFDDSFEVTDLEPIPPGPNPPGPNPPPGPTPTPTGIKAVVKEALKTVTAAALPQKKMIAGHYAGVAGEAKANPTSWDAATMVNEVKVRIGNDLPADAYAGWKEFWKLLTKGFVELKLQASDLAGHIKAFEDVAAALNE